MAGGATYSEVRTAYKVSEASNKDVYLGTTHLVTPQQFARDLSGLARGGSSHLNKGFQPAKKPLPPRAPGIPQQAIDQRYHQKIQAPPPPQPQARPPPDSRRPSSIASSLTGKVSSSQSMMSPLGPASSASSAPTSLNGSTSSTGSKVKKKGFLKKLL